MSADGIIQRLLSIERLADALILEERYEEALALLEKTLAALREAGFSLSLPPGDRSHVA